MEVQHGNSQQVLSFGYFFLFNSINRRLGCGGLENLTFGNESRNYIKFIIDIQTGHAKLRSRDGNSR
jgi:hypothetical protein